MEAADLLGFDAIELLTEVISHRADIANSLHNLLFAEVTIGSYSPPSGSRSPKKRNRKLGHQSPRGMRRTFLYFVLLTFF